jgi:hypothetical protein
VAGRNDGAIKAQAILRTPCSLRLPEPEQCRKSQYRYAPDVLSFGRARKHAPGTRWLSITASVSLASRSHLSATSKKRSLLSYWSSAARPRALLAIFRYRLTRWCSTKSSIVATAYPSGRVATRLGNHHVRRKPATEGGSMLPAFGHVAELRRSGLQQRPDWQAVPLDLHRIGQSKLNSLPHRPASSSHLRASFYI